MNRLDRLISWMSPSWGQARSRARLMARHFEAASVGRRTEGWSRRATDANAAAAGAALGNLRAQARDLVRNNPWARNGLRLIATDVVGWGIRPKPAGDARGAERIAALWKKWAETTQCDAAGRLDFYGLQWLVMRTVAESGEVLIRRRMRRPEDGLAIPMQLQVLEPDYIDTGKDGIKGEAGGKIVQGIEFDAIGRRVAYWLFDEHPGSNSSLVSPVSRRIPADGILHVYDIERPGQVRGPSWFASVDVRLHEFDEFEDATLMKQKIAACMAAFVTDLDGNGAALGEAGTDASGAPTDSFEPGMIVNLPQGKQVTVANPPSSTDHQSFSTTALRGVAAGIGVTYEGLTGDYSQVNYSSARMGRNVYTANRNRWLWMMLVPQFCAPVWSWMLDAAILAGEKVDNEPATWTPPPLPMLDPDKEGAATTKAVRAGQMTHDEMVREQGRDPEEFWKEYAEAQKRLDKYGIVLDSDPRRMSAGGQAQAEQKPAASAKTGGATDDSADTDERYYEEIRIAYGAALESERKRADEWKERLGAFRAAVAEEDERIKMDINELENASRTAAEEYQRKLQEERSRGDEAAAAARADADAARTEAARLAVEMERARAEHERELAAIRVDSERALGDLRAQLAALEAARTEPAASAASDSTDA